MTTKDLANTLAPITDPTEIYRRLLLFLLKHSEGYSVCDGPRGLARAAAASGHYFWLPCLLCSQWYGGQERTSNGIMLTERQGAGVCPNCTDEAARVGTLFPRGISVRQEVFEP
jgi:hypothetical protein